MEGCFLGGLQVCFCFKALAQKVLSSTDVCAGYWNSGFPIAPMHLKGGSCVFREGATLQKNMITLSNRSKKETLKVANFPQPRVFLSEYRISECCSNKIFLVILASA